MENQVLYRLRAYYRLFRYQANTFESRYAGLLNSISFEKKVFRDASKDHNQSRWWSTKTVGLVFIAVFTAIFGVMMIPILFALAGGQVGLWEASGFWELKMTDPHYITSVKITIPLAVAISIYVGYFRMETILRMYLWGVKVFNTGTKNVQLTLPI